MVNKSNQVNLKISALIEDVSSGLTRYKKDDCGFGSIQVKYTMTDKEVLMVFNHPKLKDLKEISLRFNLIDDVNDTDSVKETVAPAPEIVKATPYVSDEDFFKELTKDVIKGSEMIKAENKKVVFDIEATPAVNPLMFL